MAKTNKGIVVTAAAIMTASALAAPEAAAHAKPRCPLIFGHGGYPKNPNATDKDRIRQPNNPSAVKDMRRRGAHGVEADVQLTRNGTKAVMWHNMTTNGLTGSHQRITDLSWASGPDNLRGRRISHGPYKGERVYTLRQWLEHLRSARMIALLEIKPYAKRVLASKTHGARAWKELSKPIRERQRTQPIMVYSYDTWIQKQLAKRHPKLLRGSYARWTDGVSWDEPPPSWKGNISRWQSILKLRPKSIMTNYPKEYRRWVAGRCK